MEDFEDVDLNFSERSTRDELNNGQMPLQQSADLSNFEARRLGIKEVRIPSEEAYQQAFSPFYTHCGTPYPCSQNDLDVHNIGAFHEQNNRSFVSAMEATREVMLQNHVSRRVPPSELLAIDNLQKTIYAVEKRMDFGPDLAIKAFIDLDLVFFGGQLRDNVRVLWVKASDHPSFAAPTGPKGAAIQLPERGKCLIMLNADLHLRRRQSHDDVDDPLRLIFGTLLHEMCHAYEIVSCGLHSCTKRRGHDDFFATRITVVHKRAVRVLGLWAIGRNEWFVQYHSFEGERTAAGTLAVARAMGLVSDMGEKVEKITEVAKWGVEAVRRWMLHEDEDEGVVDE